MNTRSSIDIDREAGEVFAVVADFSRNPEWQGGMRSATWTSEPPVRIGSTYDQEARFVGRDVVTTFEVVAFDPGRSITAPPTIQNLLNHSRGRLGRRRAAPGPSPARSCRAAAR